jgi:UDP-glucose 4-epimerase
MKILVTGGCGFIGSHLVDALVDKNHEVVVIDDCSADNDLFYFNDKAEYHKKSICDVDTVNNLTQNCDFIFHLAAESRLQNSILNPKRAVDVNIVGTLNILEACRINKVKGLLFSSTSCVYGLTKSLPITENLSEDCLNPYGSTKYAAELLIKNYVKLYNVNSCIFRYFNVFGERSPSNGPYALVTGIFLKQKKNNLPLTIVGSGLQERDFIYVKDVVNANIMAMENWVNPKMRDGNIYNVGSGKAIKIIDIAKVISENMIFIPVRQGEADNNLCSNKKLMNAINWIPQINILDWLKTQ